MLRVFLSYSHEDLDQARALYELLTGNPAVNVWFDEESLLPGMKWEAAIRKAIGDCRFFLLLLSSKSAGKKGFYQREVRMALKVLDEYPDNDIFLIPARLDVCEPQSNKLKDLQYVDLFPDWNRGVNRILSVLKTHGRPQGRVSLSRNKVWMVPRRNPFFTGREAILDALRVRLAEGQLVTRAQAITGLGGIGKTQTIVEYCHRHGGDYPYVLWVNAASKRELSLGFVDVARELGLASGLQNDLDLVRKMVCSWLNTTPNWLLVFDNADSPDILAPFLPSRDHGHLVVISRTQHIPGFSCVLDLDVMSYDEAVSFMERRVRRKLSGEELAFAGKLAEELGYLPLAIEQAATYIGVHRVTFLDYFESYRRRRLDLLEKTGPREGQYPWSVATTWAVSFQQVNTELPATDALRLSAFLAPDAIPIEFFTEGAEKLGPQLSEVAEMLRDPLGAKELLLEPLTRYSLIYEIPETRAFNMHRLVQVVVKDGLSSEEQLQWLTRAVEALEVVFPGIEYENWPACERLYSHALVLSKSVGDTNLCLPSAGILMYKVGAFAQAQGRFDEARRLFQDALMILKQAYGDEHPVTLASMNNLAEAFRASADYNHARAMHEEVLEIRRRQFGNDHAAISQSINNLALTLLGQGELEGARELLNEGMEIFSREIGNEHPDTFRLMANLATILRAQGELRGAQELFEKAVKGEERELGEQHPETLESMNGLAQTLRDLGRISDARDLLEEIWKIRKAVLGERHPHSLTSMNDLAVTLWDLGDLDSARRLAEEMLVLRKQESGDRHPHAASGMVVLAHILQAQGEMEQALELFEEARGILAIAFGDEHPETLKATNSAGEALRAQGNLDGAIPLFEGTLEIQRRTIGGEHPDSLITLNNLAVTLRARGEAAKARALYEYSLEILNRSLGKEHPHTLLVMNNLGLTLTDLNDFAGARQLLEEALVGTRRLFGEQHPQTLRLMHNLGQVFHALGEFSAALELLGAASAGASAVLGEEHPHTLEYKRSLYSLIS